MTTLLQLSNIVKTFRKQGKMFHAVDGVSLSINRGQTFGLVGESGSGKSTLARCALQLIPLTSGTTVLDGQDLGALTRAQLRRARADTGMVFQNPVAALNPRMRVKSLVAEPLVTHTNLRGPELQERVRELLDSVGLAAEHAQRLPHQLSGGQCQRIGIARALATNPKLLVLDEPTSALDVSVQAQILNLLRDLREQHGLTYLLISHDLEVVRYMSDHVGVMRQGQLIENGLAAEVFENPQHDYTRELLDASPGSRHAQPLVANAEPASIQ